jgi:hypothetical protein
MTGLVKALSTSNPGIVETPKEMKKRQKSLNLELLSLVFDDISFCNVDEAKTEKQPDGNLFMAWKRMDMFELLTPSTRLTLKKESQNSKL